ncbi:hypothetical protein O6H91_04G019800 [Diphasiastrum complanatum]|uniref:Uncharacterized protein n=1 Tax=Diphasiastrum complanatum TaxID=34168 RepID=A0ACC2DUN2_DIPCM|nr:hypothetical protein O6H91_04G019800 [Diphasiastrum complanatum]
MLASREGKLHANFLMCFEKQEEHTRFLQSACKFLFVAMSFSCFFVRCRYIAYKRFVAVFFSCFFVRCRYIAYKGSQQESIGKFSDSDLWQSRACTYVLDSDQFSGRSYSNTRHPASSSY